MPVRWVPLEEARDAFLAGRVHNAPSPSPCWPPSPRVSSAGPRCARSTRRGRATRHPTESGAAAAAPGGDVAPACTWRTSSSTPRSPGARTVLGAGPGHADADRQRRHLETRLTVDGGPMLDLCFQRSSDPRLPRRGCTSTCTAGRPGRHGRAAARGSAPATSTSARATCRGWCWPTPRARLLRDGGAGGLPRHRPVGGHPDPRHRPRQRRSVLGGAVRLAASTPGQPPSRCATPPDADWSSSSSPRSDPKHGKNQLHLDLRLEAATTQQPWSTGSRRSAPLRIDNDWGDLPWHPCTDPSGNEFCILPARHDVSVFGAGRLDGPADGDCPCGAGGSLRHCCRPLHDGSANAESAVRLMRSRYSRVRRPRHGVPARAPGTPAPDLRTSTRPRAPPGRD